MSHRSLLGLPDIPPRFSDLLVTELGANCADPRGGSGLDVWLDKARSQVLSPTT